MLVVYHPSSRRTIQFSTYHSNHSKLTFGTHFPSCHTRSIKLIEYRPFRYVLVYLVIAARLADEWAIASPEQSLSVSPRWIHSTRITVLTSWAVTSTTPTMPICLPSTETQITRIPRPMLSGWHNLKLCMRIIQTTLSSRVTHTTYPLRITLVQLQSTSTTTTRLISPVGLRRPVLLVIPTSTTTRFTIPAAVHSPLRLSPLRPPLLSSLKLRSCLSCIIRRWEVFHRLTWSA